MAPGLCLDGERRSYDEWLVSQECALQEGEAGGYHSAPFRF